jgi:hypothetical protein
LSSGAPWPPVGGPPSVRPSTYRLVPTAAATFLYFHGPSTLQFLPNPEHVLVVQSSRGRGPLFQVRRKGYPRHGRRSQGIRWESCWQQIEMGRGAR